jgi:hypothetical protein
MHEHADSLTSTQLLGFMTPEEVAVLPGRIATCLRDAAASLLDRSTVVQNVLLGTLAPMELTPIITDMGRNVGRCRFPDSAALSTTSGAKHDSGT